jgi:hypothetical protein
MNKLFTIILAACLLCLAACYKDKGNYDYQYPEEPKVTNLDTVYAVFVGDSLIIKPVVSMSNKANLHYEWRIAVPEQLSQLSFNGPELHTIFGLNASRYNGRFTIIDSSNGMKYFYSFVVQGKTDFYKGATVLSREGNKTQLSFIKPDGTIQPRIYQALHNGEELAADGQQVIAIVHQYIAPSDVTSYWILGKNGENTGVQIDANTFKRIKYLKGNFFDQPAVAQPGQFECSANGVLQGVVNGKLYVGATQTWSGSPVYGMFGLPAEGDYSLFRQAAFNGVAPYFLGYDVIRKQFVGFTNFGSPAYIGATYQVASTTAFDPVNVGLDMVYFAQVNNNNCFAFAKDGSGVLQELKFGAAFMGFVKLSPEYKRPFSQPALITPDTKWAVSPAEIFFFSSGSTIYRYNPLNQEIKPLVTDFGGKAVSMVKVIDNGNTLLTGTEGSLYYLDISTGKFGDIIKKTDGIPGAPIDVAFRK